MRSQYLYLLIGLMLYLVAVPVAVQFLPEAGSILLDFALAVLLIGGVRSVANSRRWFRICAALAVLGIGLQLANLGLRLPSLVVLVLAVALVIAVIVGIVALRDVLFGGEVNINRLVGSVCVYLLIGIAWSFLYTLAYMAFPDAFLGIASARVETHAHVFEFLYYSFVTLTTIGYGEIAPVLPVARTLAYLEAILGQFYLAILVAGLLGMHLSTRTTA